MLGPAIVIYLGLPPGPWTEWLVSLIFAVLGTLVLRHLIWLSWPTLRKVEAFRKSGWHLDAIILSALLLNFSNNIPVPIYGNLLFTYFLKLFFILTIFRHMYAIGNLCFESKALFLNWSPLLRQRWKFLLRFLLIVWGVSSYGMEYLPMGLLSSGAFLVILILGCIAIFPVILDIVLGWSLIQSLLLEIGQTVQIKTGQDLFEGTITDIKWMHLVLTQKEDSSSALQIPWREVYRGKISLVLNK